MKGNLFFVAIFSIVIFSCFNSYAWHVTLRSLENKSEASIELIMHDFDRRMEFNKMMEGCDYLPCIEFCPNHYSISSEERKDFTCLKQANQIKFELSKGSILEVVVKLGSQLIPINLSYDYDWQDGDAIDIIIEKDMSVKFNVTNNGNQIRPPLNFILFNNDHCTTTEISLANANEKMIYSCDSYSNKMYQLDISKYKMLVMVRPEIHGRGSSVIHGRIVIDGCEQNRDLLIFAYK